MKPSVFVFDPTVSDKLSHHRGVGRYLQILKENFPDWIFTDNLLISQKSNNPTAFINPFFNLFQPPLTMKRIAQKQICVIHDLIPIKYPQHFPIGIKGKINFFLNKLALKNYDTIVTDSQASKKDIINILGLPENKVKVIYPCLPKEFTDKKVIKKLSNEVIKEENKNSNYSITQLLNYCLYVGDATWNKNLVNLAKAIKIINVTCVFVGKVFEKQKRSDLLEVGPHRNLWQREFYEFLQEVRDDKRFIFLGFVDDYKLINLYQQARVNILPSRAEGFGFSYLEAASQNCPSVLADIPVLQEVSDGQALFANTENPHEIANAIGEIYFNHNVRKSFGEKAHQRSKFFSPSRFKKTFLKTIQSL